MSSRGFSYNKRRRTTSALLWYCVIEFSFQHFDSEGREFSFVCLLGVREFLPNDPVTQNGFPCAEDIRNGFFNFIFLQTARAQAANNREKKTTYNKVQASSITWPVAEKRRLSGVRPLKKKTDDRTDSDYFSERRRRRHSFNSGGQKEKKNLSASCVSRRAHLMGRNVTCGRSNGNIEETAEEGGGAVTAGGGQSGGR